MATKKPVSDQEVKIDDCNYDKLILDGILKLQGLIKCSMGQHEWERFVSDQKDPWGNAKVHDVCKTCGLTRV